MELLVFAAIVVLFLGALVAAALLSRPKKRQAADMATGAHQRRHEASPPHKPEEWTRSQ